MTLGLGLAVAGWRASLQRRDGGQAEPSRQRMAAVVREMEISAALAGSMWVLATLLIDPTLAQSQFLTTMSHEIRTPLNGVLGALDLLRQTPLDQHQRRLVKTAAESGASLMEILNDVLDHSKIGVGVGAESRGLSLALEIGPGVPDAVVGDAPRLKQVLLNLQGNGVKFTEQGGVVLRLAAQAAGPDTAAVTLAVQDSGIGIPPHALQQVFHPFHQVDGTRSRLRGGTGLGLAICQQIVQAMGGQIEVESCIGVGSSFSFGLLLPLARSLPLTAGDSSFGGLDEALALPGVVLLVEDNAVNRMIGAEILKSFGLQVLEAEDGAQALALLERQPVGLVLMDIQMPLVDGYAATRQLRERESCLGLPRVPVVALTANAFDDDAAQALAAGMDAHLAKPYSRRQLLELLRRWL